MYADGRDDFAEGSSDGTEIGGARDVDVPSYRRDHGRMTLEIQAHVTRAGRDELPGDEQRIPVASDVADFVGAEGSDWRATSGSRERRGELLGESADGTGFREHENQAWARTTALVERDDVFGDGFGERSFSDLLALELDDDDADAGSVSVEDGPVRKVASYCVESLVAAVCPQVVAGPRHEVVRGTKESVRGSLQETRHDGLSARGTHDHVGRRGERNRDGPVRRDEHVRAEEHMSSRCARRRRDERGDFRIARIRFEAP